MRLALSLVGPLALLSCAPGDAADSAECAPVASGTYTPARHTIAVRESNSACIIDSTTGELSCAAGAILAAEPTNSPPFDSVKRTWESAEEQQVCVHGAAGWWCDGAELPPGTEVLDAADYHCYLDGCGAPICDYPRESQTRFDLPGGGLDIGVAAAEVCVLMPDNSVQCGDDRYNIWATEAPGPSDTPVVFFDYGPWIDGCVIREGGALECWGWYSSVLANEPFDEGTFRWVSTGVAICTVALDGALACWSGAADSRGLLATPDGLFVEVEVGEEIACARGEDDSVTCFPHVPDWPGEAPSLPPGVEWWVPQE